MDVTSWLGNQFCSVAGSPHSCALTESVYAHGVAASQGVARSRNNMRYCLRTPAMVNRHPQARTVLFEHIPGTCIAVGAKLGAEIVLPWPLHRILHAPIGRRLPPCNSSAVDELGAAMRMTCELWGTAGCHVCEGIYAHFRLPNGKLAHFFDKGSEFQGTLLHCGARHIHVSLPIQLWASPCSSHHS
jgi:hypothetical protein